MKSHSDDDDDKTGSGGGQTGEVHFRFKDPYSVASREDLLPAHEINRLLAVDDILHKAVVNKQKMLLELREAIKNNKNNFARSVLQQKAYGRGSDHSGHYKTHPAFANQPEGMRDKQLETRPANLDPDKLHTNPELQNKLTNQLTQKLQQRAEQRPVFNPNPRPK